MNSTLTVLERIEAVVLQVSHRIAIGSILALMVAWAMLVRFLSDPTHAEIFKAYRHVLAAAFAGGDLAIAGGILALIFAQKRGGRTREARTLILLGSAILLLSLPVLILSKLDLMKL